MYNMYNIYVLFITNSNVKVKGLSTASGWSNVISPLGTVQLTNYSILIYPIFGVNYKQQEKAEHRKTRGSFHSMSNCLLSHNPPAVLLYILMWASMTLTSHSTLFCNTGTNLTFLNCRQKTNLKRQQMTQFWPACERLMGGDLVMLTDWKRT